MILVDGVKYRPLKDGEDICPGDLKRTSPITRPAKYEPATLFTADSETLPMWPKGKVFRVSSMSSGWAYLRKV